VAFTIVWVMSDSYIQNLFAERIGGKLYGKSTAIYKFEMIKRAKRAALAAHPGVERVIYPARKDHPTSCNAKRFLRRGGGMLGLYVYGGFEAAKQVVSRTRLFSHAANMGDCKSLIIHPASTTHSPVDPETRRAVGIADNFLRLSVGLEHIDDLTEDLEEALAA